jgi:hypothetical protein
MCIGASRVPVLILLAACAGFCQRSEAQSASKALPDAPSALVSAKSAPYRRPLSDPTISRSYLLQTAFEGLYKLDSGPRQECGFLARQLLSAQTGRYFSNSESGSLIGRAMNAATHTFISRTPSGQPKLNTSYFLGVLTSAVIHTAYRPYWNRPVSAPFSNFGSTVGNDAGMNLLHEFGPGLEQLMKSHTPKFVSRIEAGIGRK